MLLIINIYSYYVYVYFLLLLHYFDLKKLRYLNV
jgi:hypothetical protein